MRECRWQEEIWTYKENYDSLEPTDILDQCTFNVETET